MAFFQQSSATPYTAATNNSGDNTEQQQTSPIVVTAQPVSINRTNYPGPSVPPPPPPPDHHQRQSMPINGSNNETQTLEYDARQQQQQQRKHRDYSVLPKGWITAIHPEDGRIYYYEKSTGTTSWVHPYASEAVEDDPNAASTGVSSYFTRHFSRFYNSKRNKNNPNQSPNPPGVFLPPPPHQENPLYATSKPDTHECNSFMALLLCPPVGLLAMYHTLSVNWAWEEGRYGDSVNHARQAPKYASLAMCLGIVFWIWWFFFRRDSENNWFDFDFDFGN